MKRLVLVAEDSLVIQALILGLRGSGEFRLIGRFPPAAGIQDLAAAAPDVVLVDDAEDAEQTVELIRQIRAHRSDAVVIMLALDPDSPSVAAAFAAGAAGAVSKAAQPAAIMSLIRETIHGRILNVSRTVADVTATAGVGVGAGVAATLSPRELQVLRLLAGGFTNAQIAQQLWVTEQTVKFHLSNIYRKLGVENRTEATNYAHVNRLVPGPGSPP